MSLVDKPSVTLVTLVPPVKKKLTETQKKRKKEIALFDDVSRIAEDMFPRMYLTLLAKRAIPGSVEQARAEANQDSEAAARYSFIAAAKFFEHKENMRGAFVSEE